MRLCFVSRETVEAVAKKAEEIRADLLLFGFNGIDGEVSYERELKGETAYFEDVALLSREYRCIVVCGCITNTRGMKRKSVVVAENGRILGVSDMLNCLDRSFNPGVGIKSFDTKQGKIGIAVGEDIYFPETFRTLSASGSDLIVCPFERTDGVESILLRAAAFSYCVPIAMIGEGYACFADVDGSLAFSSPFSPVCSDRELKKEFKIVETRRRGFYKKEKCDY